MVDDKSMTLFWTELKDRTHRDESEMMIESGGISIKLDASWTMTCFREVLVSKTGEAGSEMLRGPC